MFSLRLLDTSSRFVRFYCRFGNGAVANNYVTGLFGNPMLNSPQAFNELFNKVQKNSMKIVDQIINKQRSKKVVALMDDLSNEICCAADLVECVRLMHSQESFSNVASETMCAYTELVESLNTRSDIYNVLKNSLNDEKDILTDVDKRTIALFMADFENSGVHLSDEKKKQFVQLSREIFEAGSKFVQTAEIPVEIAHSDRKTYHVERFLRNPNPFTISEEARRWTFKTYYRFVEQQENSLRHLVTCRHRLARLTGFDTYAHRAQQFSVLGGYDGAHNFLIEVIKCCRPAAERELTVLLDLLSQCDSHSERIGEWDLQYLFAVYRQKAYGDTSSVSRYLSLKSMLNGFELIVKRLYGAHFVLEKPSESEIWQSNVIKITVFDQENSIIGVIYVDIERRPSKISNDCHFTIQCSKLLENGIYQKPIVVVSLSVADGDMLMENIYLSGQQAENFFHEMGHAMHSMLGRTQYQHVAGTRCPTDMAEIPSNLMEYFFNDLSILREIAKDENDNRMNIDEAASMITSRFAFSATEILQQATYALFDLELFGHNAVGIMNGSFSTTDLFNSIKSIVFPSLEIEKDCAWHHRFTHLFPYGGRYHSYLVARAAASLIWNSRFREDPLNAKSGAMWSKVQSYGGSLPSSDLLHQILGYWPTGQILASALKNEANATCQQTAINF